jgi:predicted RNA-binding Zn ribbon-like protein
MCLDLTHTGGEGEYAEWELFYGPLDVVRYLSVIVGTNIAAPKSHEFAELRALRTAITIAARTLVTGNVPNARYFATINKTATGSPLVPQFAGSNGSVLLPGGTSAALSTIARDAIDVFSSPLSARIRICGAEDCGLLFVDASRPGQRRWCSMQWCGDRAKKRSIGQPVAEERNDG